MDRKKCTKPITNCLLLYTTRQTGLCYTCQHGSTWYPTLYQILQINATYQISGFGYQPASGIAPWTTTRLYFLESILTFRHCQTLASLSTISSSRHGIPLPIPMPKALSFLTRQRLHLKKSWGCMYHLCCLSSLLFGILLLLIELAAKHVGSSCFTDCILNQYAL